MPIEASRLPVSLPLRAGRRTLLAAVVLLAAPHLSLAQWDLRLIGNYQAARLGETRFENSYQELLARRAYMLNEVNSLNVTARLRRDENHLEGNHVFTGQVDGDLRTPSWNLFLRHRPTQSPGLTQPAEWRRRETVFGGSLGLDGLPQLRYEEAHRRRQEGDTLSRKSNALDRRFTSTWSLRGVSLDFSHRRTENGSPAAAGQPIRLKRNARDTGGGAEWTHVFSEKLSAGVGLRTIRSRWETAGSRTRDSGYERAETNLSFLPWRILTLTTGGSWQLTRQRENGDPWRRDRLLDVNSSLTLRPTRYLTTTLLRTYQEQRNPGLPANRLDNARAQVTAVGRVLPELELSGAAARNWTLSQRGLSAPSNQASLGLRADLRRGVALAYTLAAQVLDSAPKAIRRQVSQNADLRLQASPNSRFAFGVQSYRLGEKLTLRHQDRIFYRIDGLLSGTGGASVSATYSSQVLRSASTNEKYSLAGQITVPWKGLLLSASGTASRASGAIARLGRPWGLSSASSVRARIYRRSDLTVSYTRSLPAIESGSSIWQAVLTQRFR